MTRKARLHSKAVEGFEPRNYRRSTPLEEVLSSGIELEETQAQFNDSGCSS